MVNKNKKAIRDLAAYVCDSLAGKVVIHRYDAYSTNSVYLKFDYGVGNSLRISDHKERAEHERGFWQQARRVKTRKEGTGSE